eukprot:TRINITY_DN631_c0_g1_i5.p2 TRINITY_DN631_c0_g1~~TRINITY_DN631_c0_g1_i5.p2  ORF type:complete len:123 (+),score=14.98 TRINITY_DN631_c0_g1_i5:107-475(+)
MRHNSTGRKAISRATNRATSLTLRAINKVHTNLFSCPLYTANWYGMLVSWCFRFMPIGNNPCLQLQTFALQGCSQGHRTVATAFEMVRAIMAVVQMGSSMHSKRRRVLQPTASCTCGYLISQ